MTQTAPLSPSERLRAVARTGAISTKGAPTGGDEFIAGAAEEGSSPPAGSSTVGRVAPGVFTSPTPEAAPAAAPAPAAKAPAASQPDAQSAAPVKSAQDKLRDEALAAQNSKTTIREMAAVKTLTRLLEAVYARPGSSASEAQRIEALSTLSSQALKLGAVVASLIGEDAERSAYIRAVSMDAVVGLVTKQWEQGLEVDWEALIVATADVPEISVAANTLAEASYRPVKTVADAADRISTSMHAAFWQVYSLGESVDGMTARLAAEVVRDCATYLQGREKFVVDNDLYVAWLQGSVRRLTDLVCAEMRARFGKKGVPPTPEDVRSVLDVARSGFEGVENYAQNILEKPSAAAVPRPVDR